MTKHIIITVFPASGEIFLKRTQNGFLLCLIRACQFFVLFINYQMFVFFFLFGYAALCLYTFISTKTSWGCNRWHCSTSGMYEYLCFFSGEQGWEDWTALGDLVQGGFDIYMVIVWNHAAILESVLQFESVNMNQYES